jgi:hypothetical protein
MTSQKYCDTATTYVFETVPSVEVGPIVKTPRRHSHRKSILLIGAENGGWCRSFR